jgi:eukaryotic-like serine/threonine-protein kinase
MLSSVFRFIFSKAFWINAVIAAVLVFFAAKWMLGYLDKYTLHGETTEVPDFTGKKIEDLDDFISGSKIQYIIIDSVYKTDKPRGTVIDQDPLPGSQVKEGRKIYLTVNAKLPLRVSLPDMTDVTLRQATAILEYYGLKVGNKKYIPDQCFNCVLRMEIRGHRADAGTLVEKNTTVDLVLGQGQSSELVQIPDLYGKTSSEINEQLTSIALNFMAVSYENCATGEDSSAARAFRQSPPYEKDVSINLGSTINVWFTCDKNKVKVAEPDTLN